jgi:hypothetical protein
MAMTNPLMTKNMSTPMAPKSVARTGTFEKSLEGTPRLYFRWHHITKRAAMPRKTCSPSSLMVGWGFKSKDGLLQGMKNRLKPQAKLFMALVTSKLGHLIR